MSCKNAGRFDDEDWEIGAQKFIAAVRQPVERPSGAAAQPAVDDGSTPSVQHEGER